MACPVKTSKEWLKLVSGIGELNAYKVFISNGEEIPEMSIVDDIINDFVDNTVDKWTPNRPNLLQSSVLSKAEQDADSTEKSAINALKSFLSSIGINIAAVDRLMMNGYSADAISFISTKTILYAQDKLSADLLSEETGHFILEGLGDEHSLVKAMLFITPQTKEYLTVKDKYSKIYNNNEQKNKKEAAGQILGKYIKEGVISEINDKTLAGKLKNIMDSIIKRIKQLFKSADAQVLQKQMDNIFGRVAGIVTGKIEEKLSFKDKNEQYAAISKNVSIIDDFIQKTENIIKRLEDIKKRRGQLKSTADIDKRITFYKNRLYGETDSEGNIISEKLGIVATRDMSMMMDLAEKDLLWIEKQLFETDNKPSKYDEMTQSQKLDFFTSASQGIATWMTFKDFPRTGDKYIDEKKTYIAGKAHELHSFMFNNTAAKFISEHITGGQIQPEDIFKKLQPVGWLESQTIDISQSPNPIGQYVFLFFSMMLDEAKGKHEEHITTSKKIIDDLTNYLNETGISYRQLIDDLFLEKYDNNDYTGNYTGEISPEFYKKKKTRIDNARETGTSLAWKKYYKWLNENTIVTINNEKFLEDMEFMKQEYIDENSVFLDDDGKKEFEEWKEFNDPMIQPITQAKSKYISRIPNSNIWENKQYNIIKTTYKNTPIEKAYDFLIEKFNFYKKMYPPVTGISDNYMPEVRKSLMETILEGGGMEILATFPVNLIDAMKNSIRYNPETINDNTLLDEDGKLEKRIPVYMMKNVFPDKNSSLWKKLAKYGQEQALVEWRKSIQQNTVTDPFKVLDIFAASALVYHYKQLAEEPLKLIKKMIWESSTQQDVLYKDTDGNILKRTWEGFANRENFAKQMEYFVDSMLYGATKEHTPLARTGILSKIESGKLTDIFTSYVVLKYMALNILAPGANLGIGVMSTIRKGVGGGEYSLTDSLKALGLTMDLVVDPANLAYLVNKKGLIDTPGGKIIKLGEYFNIDMNPLDTQVISGGVGKVISDGLMLAQRGSEYFIRFHTMVSVLFGEKTINKNGKKRSIWDALKLKDGKIIWDSDNFSGEEYEKFLSRKYGIGMKINDTAANLHGAYGSLYTILGSKQAAGRVLMTFKKWAFRTWRYRFAKRRKSIILGKETQGIWRGLGNSMLGKADTLDKQGAKETMFDITMWITLLLAINMIKSMSSDDDDDDNNKTWLKYLLLQLSRLKNDMLFYLGGDYWKGGSTAIVPHLSAIWDITQTINDMWMATFPWLYPEYQPVITKGTNRGKNRIGQDVLNLLPAEYQIKKAIHIKERVIPGLKKGRRGKVGKLPAQYR